MCPQGFHPIQITQVQGTQGGDLLWSEIHVPQRCQITLGQTTQRIQQHGSDQIGFLGALVHVASHSDNPWASAK